MEDVKKLNEKLKSLNISELSKEDVSMLNNLGIEINNIIHTKYQKDLYKKYLSNMQYLGKCYVRIDEDENVKEYIKVLSPISENIYTFHCLVFKLPVKIEFEINYEFHGPELHFEIDDVLYIDSVRLLKASDMTICDKYEEITEEKYKEALRKFNDDLADEISFEKLKKLNDEIAKKLD